MLFPVNPSNRIGSPLHPATSCMIFPSAMYCLFKVDQAPEQNGTALLPRPVGRPSHKPLVEYKGFPYPAPDLFLLTVGKHIP